MEIIKKKSIKAENAFLGGKCKKFHFWIFLHILWECKAQTLGMSSTMYELKNCVSDFEISLCSKVTDVQSLMTYKFEFLVVS